MGNLFWKDGDGCHDMMRREPGQARTGQKYMWSTLDLGGKPVDFFDPSGDRPRFALLFLHDSAGETLRETLRGSEWLARHSLPCVCPHGGPHWWSSRLSPEFDPQRSVESWLIEEVLPAIADRWQLGPNRLAIAGMGMGGQGALRLAFRYPDRFRTVAALDAALDHHEWYGRGTPLDEMYASREHCRQDTALLHIHPARQPGHIWFGVDPASRWYRGNDRLHEKLMALGVPHTFEIGREIERQEELMARFVSESLLQESRRLL